MAVSSAPPPAGYALQLDRENRDLADFVAIADPGGVQVQTGPAGILYRPDQVVEAVAWFLAAPVGQYQHVSISLVDCREAHHAVQRWSILLATAVTLFAALVSIPVVRRAVLGVGFGLDSGLLSDIGAALPFTVAYPLLYGHRQYYQGLFTRAGRSDAVGWGAALRVATVLAVAVVGLGPLGDAGATLGVLSAIAGLIVEGVFLERVSQTQVIPLLPDSRPARDDRLSSAGAA